MEEYILIREYPGSPKLGSIGNEENRSKLSDKYLFKEDCLIRISRTTIESNPDFWTLLRFKLGDVVKHSNEKILNTIVTLDNIVQVNKFFEEYNLHDGLPLNYNMFKDDLIIDKYLMYTSKKYSHLLSILDTLLNLRDRYNEDTLHDGIYYIIYRRDTVISACDVANNTTSFNFNTAENRDLFLNNFRPQLELIKELL